MLTLEMLKGHHCNHFIHTLIRNLPQFQVTIPHKSRMEA
ncbi:hypothetical protein M8C21_000693 [Ambrosia artemisiifolia]|uniref:Uncharacterized protein n=1 Tax=Ambrosia artemisiifolia TaxID=4212 RepID=A0AAD5GR02_AMBAR|nr:hypothetical protein M8C21_000693 [Ambrosia artemisiifolia]